MERFDVPHQATVFLQFPLAVIVLVYLGNMGNGLECCVPVRHGFIRDTIVLCPWIVSLSKAKGHEFQKNRVPYRVPIVSLNHVP